MHDIKPCPFAGNCEKETPACSFEKSGTCPVIAKPKEEPRKLYDPLELVTIPLTRDQWAKVTNSLKNDADSFHARMVNWLGVCVNKEFAAETAARYERAYKELDALRAAIEKILHEPWEPTPDPDDGEE